MNSDQILTAIEEIAGTPSKKQKEALISLHRQLPEFLDVLKAALDPFTTYGVAKLPATKGNGTAQFDAVTWDLLDNLAARRLTGKAATHAIERELVRLTPDSEQLLRRVLTRDLRAGFTASTVNKAIPGTITTFGCQLSEKFFEHSEKLQYPVGVELKLDGYRVLTFVDAYTAKVEFFSRSGKPFTAFDHLKGPIVNMVRSWLGASPEHAKLGDQWVLDGEVCTTSFNDTGKARGKGQVESARLFAFDIVPGSTFRREDKVGCEIAGTFNTRRARLERLANHAQPQDPIHVLPVWLAKNEAEVMALYERMRSRDLAGLMDDRLAEIVLSTKSNGDPLEGVMVKQLHAPYIRRRTNAWLKIKAEETLDLEVFDIFEGTGKYVGMMGGATVMNNGVLVNVGSGFSDKERALYWRRRDLIIGHLLEVAYHEQTPDGSLRHPRAVRLRDDKPLKEAA